MKETHMQSRLFAYRFDEKIIFGMETQKILTRTFILKKSRVSFDRLRIIESRNATLEETSNVAFCFFDELIQISVMVPLGAVNSGEYVLERLQNHVKRRLELCGDVAETPSESLLTKNREKMAWFIRRL